MIDASKIQANLKVVRDELNKKDLKIKNKEKHKNRFSKLKKFIKQKTNKT